MAAWRAGLEVETLIHIGIAALTLNAAEVSAIEAERIHRASDRTRSISIDHGHLIDRVYTPGLPARNPAAAPLVAAFRQS